MARRGFFAELNYQAQQAEKRRWQQAAAANRAQAAAQREADRAWKRAESAAAAVARASAAEQKEAQKLAERLRGEARTSEVAAMNAALAQTYYGSRHWVLDLRCCSAGGGVQRGRSRLLIMRV